MINRDQVARTVASLSAMVAGDGVALQLTSVDEQQGAVEVTLSLEQAECSGCVLPPDRLRDVIGSTLRRDVPEVRRVAFTDPREATQPAWAPAMGPDSVTTVLDPVGEVAPGNPDPGPDAGPLTGLRIGIRVDVLWPAWDWTVHEWTLLLEKAGAVVTSWRRSQSLQGAEAERRQADYEAFLGEIDLLIAGLGNCGSCTSWTVKDGLAGLTRGMPTIVGVSEQFETLARTLAAVGGRPGLRLIVLPFSVHTLPEHEVRDAARTLFPKLLTNVGANAA